MWVINMDVGKCANCGAHRILKEDLCKRCKSKGIRLEKKE